MHLVKKCHTGTSFQVTLRVRDESITLMKKSEERELFFSSHKSFARSPSLWAEREGEGQEGQEDCFSLATFAWSEENRWSKMTAIDNDDEFQLNSDGDICPVCLQAIPLYLTARIQPCEHLFCVKCLQIHANSGHASDHSCPVCRGHFNTVQLVVPFERARRREGGEERNRAVHSLHHRTDDPWIFCRERGPERRSDEMQEDANEVLLNQSSERLSDSMTLVPRARRNRRSVYATLATIISITSRLVAIAFSRR